jgi:transcriptional regulator with XRE-family HTH domain
MTTELVTLRKILSMNIKNHRKRLGFSQEKLAEAAGLSTQYIIDIEGCRTWVSDKSIIKLALALNIEVFQLLVPNSEAEKLYPVPLPSDILLSLQENIKRDIDVQFGKIVQSDSRNGDCHLLANLVTDTAG